MQSCAGCSDACVKSGCWELAFFLESLMPLLVSGKAALSPHNYISQVLWVAFKMPLMRSQPASARCAFEHEWDQAENSALLGTLVHTVALFVQEPAQPEGLNNLNLAAHTRQPQFHSPLCAPLPFCRAPPASIALTEVPSRQEPLPSAESTMALIKARRSIFPKDYNGQKLSKPQVMLSLQPVGANAFGSSCAIRQKAPLCVRVCVCAYFILKQAKEALTMASTSAMAALANQHSLLD
eukprot:1160766-Pelagomonas_calceolata.AAC.6